ncbi:MAG: hypothetical protein ILA52_01915, partial [Alphaproteobacteria bacterium]|nr:hypothetical protein [Alphaproteobacteria bacterium]
MKELKNLIKFCSLLTAVFLPLSVQAQILNMAIDYQPLNLPQGFTESLANCKKFADTVRIAKDNIEVSTEYRILPDGDRCRLLVEGQTNTLVHITQDCNLTTAEAKQYAHNLKVFALRKYSPFRDKERILHDQNYLSALQIMENRQLCQIKREKIDTTANIRQNLPSCTPSAEQEHNAGIIITRQITGEQNGMCQYKYTVLNNKPNAEYVFNCSWKPEQVQEYYTILETMVVPAEEGSDFSAVMRISAQ